MNPLFYAKTILVTGGTGSIGQGLVRKLLTFQPQQIRIYSRGESDQYDMARDIRHAKNVTFVIGDVRDKDRLIRASRGAHVMFHAAALKHVPACEYNPEEAIKTNVLGTQNVIDAAMEVQAERVTFISTDKATGPYNVMGATKLLAERLFMAAHFNRGTSNTVFSCVRFGNVINSRGSVIPLFRKQISEGGPVTVTHPEMTRFIMSLDDAVSLVCDAMVQAQGGDLFILKMKSLRLMDLAQVMIEEYSLRDGYDPKDIPIQIIGTRPGEKIYEELLTLEEAEDVMDCDTMFRLPSAISIHRSEANIRRSEDEYLMDARYVSHRVPQLSRPEISRMLRDTIVDGEKKEDLYVYKKST